MRFVPQPEVVQRPDGERETHWLPGPYRDEAYGTIGLPPTLLGDQGMENTYYHDAATTYYTDNIFVERLDADRRPALRLGAWTNELELGGRASTLRRGDSANTR